MKILIALVLVTTAAFAQGKPNNVGGPPLLVSGNKYPALDGSLITNISGGGGGGNRNIPMTFDGGGVTLSGGATGCILVPFDGTITAIKLMGDAATSSATVDVQTASFATYTSSGPAGATSIKGSGSTPAMASVWAATPSLTGFTTTLPTAPSVMCFVLSSPAAATKIIANVLVTATN